MYKISLRNTYTDVKIMPEAIVDEEGLDLILKRVLLLLIADRETVIKDLSDGDTWAIDQNPNSGQHYQLTAQIVKPS